MLCFWKLSLAGCPSWWSPNSSLQVSLTSSLLSSCNNSSHKFTWWLSLSIVFDGWRCSNAAIATIMWTMYWINCNVIYTSKYTNMRPRFKDTCYQDIGTVTNCSFINTANSWSCSGGCDAQLRWQKLNLKCWAPNFSNLLLIFKLLFWVLVRYVHTAVQKFLDCLPVEKMAYSFAL